MVERTAGELREWCPNLWRIQDWLPGRVPGESASLLAVAVRYYFRREIETDQQLFHGIAFDKLTALAEVQEKGFAAVSDALSRQGELLEQLIDVATDTNERVRNLSSRFRSS